MPKIISSFLISFLFFISVTKGQNLSEDLRAADSLFAQKKYTESFKIYEAILATGEMASPRMLLKMAYIKEGLGESGEALYYLNLYHLRSKDEVVAAKMEEVGIKNGLEGYGEEDMSLFYHWYQRYYKYLLIVIAGLSLLLFGYIVFLKSKGTKPLVPAVMLLLMLIGFFFLVNTGQPLTKAIITDPKAYIMKGPSPGAGIIEVVKKGHRVDVLGKEDVWVIIRWNGERAYILENSIKQLRV